MKAGVVIVDPADQPHGQMFVAEQLRIAPLGWSRARRNRSTAQAARGELGDQTLELEPGEVAPARSHEAARGARHSVKRGRLKEGGRDSSRCERRGRSRARAVCRRRSDPSRAATGMPWSSGLDDRPVGPIQQLLERRRSHRHASESTFGPYRGGVIEHERIGLQRGLRTAPR